MSSSLPDTLAPPDTAQTIIWDNITPVCCDSPLSAVGIFPTAASGGSHEH